MSCEKGAIMKLCAFVIREVACLGDDDPVTLNATPETVRVMALRAKHERDALYDLWAATRNSEESKDEAI